MTEGIERGEGSEETGETGHQLNKDTNYGPKTSTHLLKKQNKTLNTHSYGAKKQFVCSK